MSFDTAPGNVVVLINGYMDRGARGSISGAVVLEPDGWRLHCNWCGQDEFLGNHLLYAAEANPFDLCDWADKVARAHSHCPPAPLTAEEREAERVRGIHRRGAWKLRGW